EAGSAAAGGCLWLAGSQIANWRSKPVRSVTLCGVSRHYVVPHATSSSTEQLHQFIEQITLLRRLLHGLRLPCQHCLLLLLATAQHPIERLDQGLPVHHQLLEHGLIDTVGFNGAECPHREGTGVAGEQAQLAEEVAGIEGAER